MAIDRSNLHPLIDAQTKALNTVRDSLQHNTLTGREHALLLTVRTHNLLALRHLLTLLRPASPGVE